MLPAAGWRLACRSGSPLRVAYCASGPTFPTTDDGCSQHVSFTFTLDILRKGMTYVARPRQVIQCSAHVHQSHGSPYSNPAVFLPPSQEAACTHTAGMAR